MKASTTAVAKATITMPMVSALARATTVTMDLLVVVLVMCSEGLWGIMVCIISVCFRTVVKGWMKQIRKVVVVLVVGVWVLGVVVEEEEGEEEVVVSFCCLMTRMFGLWGLGRTSNDSALGEGRDKR